MTCKTTKLSGKSLLGEKMEDQQMQQSNAALTQCLWWEKPAANDEAVSVREHYNYFRDYDPSIGRYVESDPIGFLPFLIDKRLSVNEQFKIISRLPAYTMMTNHVYLYTENNPLNKFDVYGLSSACVSNCKTQNIICVVATTFGGLAFTAACGTIPGAFVICATYGLGLGSIGNLVCDLFNETCLDDCDNC